MLRCFRNPGMIDFPGIIAGTLFVSGCNFRCGFCHNAPLMGKPLPGLPWGELESVLQNWKHNWARGAVVSGGEPTLHPGLPELLERLAGYGFMLKLDTNGSRPDVLSRHVNDLAYVAMDFKTSPQRYSAFVGSPFEPVAESMKILQERASAHELRVTLMDGEHTREVLTDMAETVCGADKIVLQPFVPRENLPNEDYRSMPRCSNELMHLAEKIFRDTVKDVQLR